MTSRNILIYRDILLPASETFILAQGEGLSRYKASYVGARASYGLTVPAERSMTINDGGVLGRCKEILFKSCGIVTPKQKRIIGKLEPLLIHAHFGPDAIFALSLAKTLSIPLIVTFHGYDATTKDSYAQKSSFFHRNYIRNRQHLIDNGTNFVAVSNFIKRKIIEQGFPEDKIIVHYIGIDVNTFQPTPGIIRKPIVLFVGRLVEKKGCSYLIKAMQTVQKYLPDTELVIIGDGPLRFQLEDEAENLLTHYRFLGTQPPNVIRDYMNIAKVFSVPSIAAESGDAEGFGIVFTEAQAMGLPVASFDSGGIPEAVAHGVTGLLTSEKDTNGLADNIISLMCDENLWHTMSKNGQKHVANHFNLQTQNQLLESIYDNILEQ